MTTNYARGAAAEYKARNRLIDLYAYVTVIRSAGSHGALDLIAIGAKPGDVLGVQVKRAKDDIREAVAKLREVPPWLRCEIWEYRVASGKAMWFEYDRMGQEKRVSIVVRVPDCV